MNNLLSGAAFGAALTASGVFQPSVIIGQLKFENFHMIQAFLTATASSAIIVTTASKLGYIHVPARSFSTIGLFAPYDGNIIGGILLGTGMLLAGACPGTVYSQIGLGVRSGFYALEGAAVAGIVWTGFLHKLLSPSSCTVDEKQKNKRAITVYEGLGVSRTATVASFAAMCAGIVYAVYNLTTLGPEAKTIPPIAGGLFIAASQLVSILLRKNLMGTSTSWEEMGDWFWGVVTKGKAAPQRYANTVYCVGMVGGAWLLSRLVPALGQVTEVDISPARAALGGFLMIIGSRMAGGCTSGHGISGMSLMSTSSFLTIGSAFAWGGVLGMLMG